MTQSLLPPDYPQLFAAWTQLLDSGDPSAAESFYFETILPAVLPVMRARTGSVPKYDGLISLLGYTPETVVITYRLLQPDVLVVLHTPETERSLETVRHRTSIPLKDFYHEAFLHDDEHTHDIHLALSRAIARFTPTARLAIEMTGGKKTMGVQLASAVASLRYLAGRAVDILYVDYDQYLPRYRKPAPETCRLLILGGPTESVVSILRGAAVGAADVRQLVVDPVFRGRGFPVEDDLVFVLMPFTAPWSDRVWKHIQRVCRDLGLRPKRANDLFGLDIVEDVWRGLCQARIVVADLTGRNPNVFYELGLAHTLGKCFVLLTQDLNDLPFDLKRFRCVVYEDNVDGFEKLSTGLTSMLCDGAPR